MPRGLCPDLVGDRAGPVGEPGGGLGECERGPLGVVEARVLVPGGEGEQLLRADTGFSRVRGASVDAGAGPASPGCPLMGRLTDARRYLPGGSALLADESSLAG